MNFTKMITIDALERNFKNLETSLIARNLINAIKRADQKGYDRQVRKLKRLAK